MIVGTLAMSPLAMAAKAVSSLEKIRLRKVAKGLVRVLPRSTSDLAVNLIVEILGQDRFWIRIPYISGSCHQLP